MGHGSLRGGFPGFLGKKVLGAKPAAALILDSPCVVPDLLVCCALELCEVVVGIPVAFLKL